MWLPTHVMYQNVYSRLIKDWIERIFADVCFALVGSIRHQVHPHVRIRQVVTVASYQVPGNATARCQSLQS